MLFSATIGPKIKDLAKINLSNEHEYIGIHDYASDRNNECDSLKSVTPIKLTHYCMKVKI